MIGIDTNVLVRYLAQDDPQQALAASQLIDGLSHREPGFVSVVTVVETFWVLRRAYQVPDVEVRRLLRGLADSVELLVQHSDEVRRALDRRGDFADGLIALFGAAAGCDYTATFDRKAAAQTEMRLLA
jgi:predicted nucleic-acid-binding protein